MKFDRLIKWMLPGPMQWNDATDIISHRNPIKSFQKNWYFQFISANRIIVLKRKYLKEDASSNSFDCVPFKFQGGFYDQEFGEIIV